VFWDLLHSSMLHWYRLVGRASEGAALIERDGLVAALVPAAPERSVPNGVVYTRPGAVAEAYDELAAAYDEIGAQWTVWVHHDDPGTAAFLEQAGHVLDAEPEGMVLDLGGGVERPPEDALHDWTADGDMAHLGPINDRSYGHGSDSFARSLAALPEGRLYLASLDGEPVACALMVDHARNSEVQMVAVVPEARGRGLSRLLLGHALADAAERGMETSTLVATRLGRPVYERLGFRAIGPLQMWERRRGPGAVP
jgi:GNAT superfamily N-acetyltransferase